MATDSETILPIYIDYKSPYAYLAKDPGYDLERDYRVRVDWRPYSLDIPDFLGTVEGRNAHQWRRVRYSYMDARRLANRRGLTVLGPKKVNNSRLVHTAMLFAKAADETRPGVFKAFHDTTFERFWKRDLDIEVMSEVQGVLAAAGADAAAFPAWYAGEGGALHDRIKREAEEFGVFGVPTFVVGTEIFWGGDRIGMVREKLDELGLRREARR
jgi:2-hydroxychromene-2-carboxylate isomerase